MQVYLYLLDWRGELIAGELVNVNGRSERISATTIAALGRRGLGQLFIGHRGRSCIRRNPPESSKV
jgi:hypothetical protein